MRSPTAMKRANETAQNNGGIRFNPMPPSMKQALTCLEFETYSALEHMEFEVGPDASVRLKRTLAAAPRRHPTQEGNIGLGAFVPKIDIQICEVQNNVRRQAKVDAGSACPPAPDVPIVIGKLVREDAPKTRALVDGRDLANFGQADHPAAGGKYHYPVTQRMSDPNTPGAVPIQGDL